MAAANLGAELDSEQQRTFAIIIAAIMFLNGVLHFALPGKMFGLYFGDDASEEVLSAATFVGRMFIVAGMLATGATSLGMGLTLDEYFEDFPAQVACVYFLWFGFGLAAVLAALVWGIGAFNGDKEGMHLKTSMHLFYIVAAIAFGAVFWNMTDLTELTDCKKMDPNIDEDQDIASLIIGIFWLLNYLTALLVPNMGIKLWCNIDDFAENELQLTELFFSIGSVGIGTLGAGLIGAYVMIEKPESYFSPFWMGQAIVYGIGSLNLARHILSGVPQELGMKPTLMWPWVAMFAAFSVVSFLCVDFSFDLN